MRKISKLVVLAGSIIFCTACKKDRTCTCTLADGSVYSKNSFSNVTKKEAKALCVSSAANITCSVQ